MDDANGMTRLVLTPTQLDQWVAQARAHSAHGRLPDYIPQLAKVSPHTVALAIRTSQQLLGSGDVHAFFSLMSVVKPFLLLYALERFGAEVVFQQVGMQPSELPFHSLVQLSQDRGFPRNPMINSGAIALTQFLSGDSGDLRCDRFCQWLNQLAGSSLKLDREMLMSVRSLANETNRTIAVQLHQAGYLDQVETAIDTYNQICCLSGTIEDLAKLGDVLARSNAVPVAHQKIVNALILTCGLYEASGILTVKIGLPVKSGVSGAMVAIVPREGAIACYGPAIDSVGNSVAGLFLIQQISQALNLSIFN